MFIGNPLGRKRAIMLGTSIMVVGASLQASAFTIEHFIIGRIITGLGNGINTSTVPVWQSETSKSNDRGKLIMIEGALITGGIALSYWIDFGLSYAPGSVAWRFPLAFQIVFCFFILAFIPFLPESPRWLILKDREDEAREILAALGDTDLNDKRVKQEFLEIKDTALEMSKGTVSDLFTMDKNRNLHRAILAYGSQLMQQVTGINLITYYAAVIYKGLGLSPFLARLLAALNGTEYFLASWPAVWLVDRVGRRNLMLWGAAGQAATMAILAGVNSRTDTSSQICGVVFLFVFNTVFALGWLGIPWLYPPEVVPLSIRAPASAMSTSANWLFNFMVVMITPVSFNTIGFQTYTVFAAINALMFPCVYFFYPETAYRSLEEMDSIFHKVTGWSAWFSVVHQAKIEPRRYGKKGELLIDYEQTEEHAQHTHGHGGEKRANDGGILSNGSPEVSTEETV